MVRACEPSHQRSLESSAVTLVERSRIALQRALSRRGIVNGGEPRAANEQRRTSCCCPGAIRAVSVLRMMQQTALEERRQNGPQGGECGQTALEERRQNGPQGGECEDDTTNGSRGEEAERPSRRGGRTALEEGRQNGPRGGEAERPSRRGVRNGLSWRGGHSRGEE